MVLFSFKLQFSLFSLLIYSRIRGYFIKYSRIFHHVSADILLNIHGYASFSVLKTCFSGKHFENTEIRPNDSIFVFVEATLPENGGNLPVTITDYLDFETNGVTKTVVLSANGQDVDRRRGQVVDVDTRLVADKPYQIFDSLVVAEGATLTLDPGVTLYFHDGAKDEYLKGMVVSTWSPMCRGVWFGTDNLKLLGDAFKDFAEAKKKFYPND